MKTTEHTARRKDVNATHGGGWGKTTNHRRPWQLMKRKRDAWNFGNPPSGKSGGLGFLIPGTDVEGCCGGGDYRKRNKVRGVNMENMGLVTSILSRYQSKKGVLESKSASSFYFFRLNMCLCELFRADRKLYDSDPYKKLQSCYLFLGEHPFPATR